MAIRDLMKRSEPEISRWQEPGALFGSLQRQMNRLFEDFTRGWPALEPMTGGFYPSIDVEETDEAVKIEADLPGMSEQDVEVTLSPDGSALTLRGERKSEKEKRTKGGYHVERSYGSFERVIELPSSVEQEKVEASFKSGVLTITLPKSPEAKQGAKRIPVKAD